MTKTKLLKGLALINFALLLTIFLAYRGGYFDSYIYNDYANQLTSSNGGAEIKKPGDSTIIKKDTLPKTMLSSSKSIVLIDNRKIKKDTVMKFKDSVAIKTTNDQMRLFSGSKSGPIFEPKSFISDSAYKKMKSKKDKKKKWQ